MKLLREGSMGDEQESFPEAIPAPCFPGMHFTYREFFFNTPEYESALRLREDILRKPLKIAWGEDAFGGDADCFHLGCFNQEKMIGTLLLKPVDKVTLKMRQVAVALNCQRQGIGTGLVYFAEEFAREKTYQVMMSHAREAALPFYIRLGYQVVGEKFTEVTLPHYKIFKML
ncbi:MAG: GNAT family N-acetyltransferase [Chthoniobacterales bacterium]